MSDGPTIFWLSIELSLKEPMSIVGEDDEPTGDQIVGGLIEVGATYPSEEGARLAVEQMLANRLEDMSYEIHYDHVGVIEDIQSEIYTDETVVEALQRDPREPGIWYQTGIAWFPDDDAESEPDLSNELSLRRCFSHLRRPWVLASGAVGTAFFVWGAGYFDAPTWDVGVSWLMSILCLLFAPAGWLLLLYGGRRRDWRMIAGGLAIVYAIASGSYEIYNTIRMGEHPITYWYNIGFSVPVTIIAGLLWSYDGSLRDMLAEVRSASHG